jgi:hypothetical protein
MKNKPLLLWGLGAGIIALVAFIVGYAFFWPGNSYENNYGMMSGSGFGGMMSGSGFGGMMSGSGFGGMMSGPTDSSTSPLSINQALDAANRYLDDYGNSDLKVKEVMEFTNNYYVRVDEQSSSAGALELLVNRNSGTVTPEPGPNMMWNTKYGAAGSCGSAGSMMFGGMMAGRYENNTAATTDMPVKKNEARDRAQRFLDSQLAGARADDPDTFYGYYTIEIEKDGRILGMLSVDGYNGRVWWHSWHGAYLSGKKL